MEEYLTAFNVFLTAWNLLLCICIYLMCKRTQARHKEAMGGLIELNRLKALAASHVSGYNL